LTAPENHFAQNAGTATYVADFITRYLARISDPEGLTPAWQYIAVAVVRDRALA
jgi:hypothetical protein